MAPKLTTYAYLRFFDLHTWSGVIASLVLYVMFITGALTLFHHELETWQEPLAQLQVAPPSAEWSLSRVEAQLQDPPDELWFSPPGSHEAAQVSYQDAAGKWHSYFVQPESGELVAQRSRVAEFLYLIHFLWHDAVGRWLYYVAGVLGVALIVSLVSGFLIHLKDIVRQFHQFRADKKPKIFWTDLHKVLGVMGLPFQLLFGYTGALLVLGPLLVQGFVGPVFDGDQKQAQRIALGVEPDPEGPAGAPTQRTSISKVLEETQQNSPELEPEVVRLHRIGHAGGFFDVWGHVEGPPKAHGMIRVDATSGEIIAAQMPRSQGTAAATRAWVQTLHYAEFGGLPLKLLYFALALATCGAFLTGNWVWLSRREKRETSRGNRALRRLTLGVGAGTWVALGAMFLSSRLLPLGLAARGRWEEAIFFIALLACLVWALLAREIKALWWRQLALAGVCCGVTPIAALKLSSAGLFGARSLGAVVAVDAGLLVAGGALVAVALALYRARGRQPDAEASHMVNSVASEAEHA